MKLLKTSKIAVFSVISSIASASPISFETNVALPFWQNRENKIVNDNITFTTKDVLIGNQNGEESSKQAKEALYSALLNEQLFFDERTLSEANKNWIMIKLSSEIMINNDITLEEAINSAYSVLRISYTTALWEHAKHDGFLWARGLGLYETIQQIKQQKDNIITQYFAAPHSAEYRKYVEKSFTEPVLKENISEVTESLKSAWGEFQTKEHLRPYAEEITNPKNIEECKEADKIKRAHAIEAIMLYMTQIMDSTVEINKDKLWADFVEAEMAFEEKCSDSEKETICFAKFLDPDQQNDTITDFTYHIQNSIDRILKPENSHVQFYSDGPEMKAIRESTIMQIQDTTNLENFSKDMLLDIAINNFLIQFQQQAQDLLVAYLFARDFDLVGHFFWNAFPFEVHCQNSYGATFQAYIDQLDERFKELAKIKEEKTNLTEFEIEKQLSHVQMQSIANSVFKYPNYFPENIFNNFLNAELLYMLLDILLRDGAETPPLHELRNMNATQLFQYMPANSYMRRIPHYMDLSGAYLGASALYTDAKSQFWNNVHEKILSGRNSFGYSTLEGFAINRYYERGNEYGEYSQKFYSVQRMFASTDDNILFGVNQNISGNKTIEPACIKVLIAIAGGTNDLLLPTERCGSIPLYSSFTVALNRFLDKHVTYEEKSWFK